MTGAIGATIFGVAGPVLSDAEARFFRAANPFGFALFARNVEDPRQLRTLTAALREAVGREATIFVDQEGGRVQRLRPPHWRDWLPALDLVDRVTATSGLEGAVRAIWLRYRIIASELANAGIDGNFAPCLDIATDATHSVLRNRCLGRDAGSVTALGRAAAEACLAGGVLPVIKHMPGHGRSTVDSHVGLPTVSTDRDVLEATDFAPFRAMADLPFAMTAHVTYVDVDPSGPATTSAPMIRLLRDGIGFRGLLMTDDLSMEALSGTPASRASAALSAGCDLILHCSSDPAEMQAVADVAGTLPPDRAIPARSIATPADMAALEAELASLLSGRARV